MSTNTPVANLAAALSLDVAGYASGVRQAEALSRRLAKAQAEALGGPGLRAAGGDDLAQRVIRGQEVRVRAQLRAQMEAARAAASITSGAGRFTPKVAEMQGPVQLRQSQIAAEIAAEMAKRVRAAKERVEIERGAEVSAARIRQQVAADEISLADQIAAGREAALQRRLAQEQAAGRILLANNQRRAREERESAEVLAAAEAKRHAAQMEQAREMASLRAKMLQVREHSRFDNANPFQQQVLATQKLNAMLRERQLLQRGTTEFAQKELEITRQIAAVRAIRNSLTAGHNLARLGTTAADSQARFARFGLAMQQTGYQVQDFAVQVASGTNALVALSQQGSQMLGFFGGFKGALAGAVLSVGILAYRLFSVSERNKEIKKSLEEVAKGYRDLERRRFEFSRGDGPAVDQLASLDREAEALRKEALLHRLSQQAAQDQVRAGKLQDVGNYGWGGMVFDLLPFGTFVADAIAKSAQLEAAQKRVVEEAQKGLEAERDRLETLREQRQVLNGLRNRRDTVLDALRPDRKGEREADNLAELVAVNAITKEQAERYKTLLEFSKQRAESDWQTGLSNVKILDHLRRQADYLREQGLGNSDEAKQVERGAKAARHAAEEEAKGYLDQLNPLREKRRELEKIRELQEAGFFGGKDVVASFAARFQDELRKAIKIPDAFSFQMSAQSSGGLAGNAQGNIQVDLNRKMLSELVRIADYTFRMAGDN